MSSGKYPSTRKQDLAHLQVDDNVMSLYQDYISQVFPNPNPLFDPDEITDWITLDSFNLFLEYYNSSSGGKNGIRSRYEPSVGDMRIVRNANRDKLDAYRKFILPPRLYRLSYFSYDNLSSWVSAKHFAEYLQKVYPFQTTEVDLIHSEAEGSCDNNSVEESISTHSVDNGNGAGKSTEPKSNDGLAHSRFYLPAFAISKPIVIPLPIPNTPNNNAQSQQVEEWCILPNFHLFLSLYFRKELNYTRKSLMEFYDSHQAAYILPVNSQFALHHVVKGGYGVQRGMYDRIRMDPLYPTKYCVPLVFEKYPELGAIFTIIEWRERKKRGLNGTRNAF